MKAEKEQRNRSSKYHSPAMKEQLTVPQKQNKKLKKYDTLPLSHYPSPTINEPLPTFPPLLHSLLSFPVTLQ